MTSSLIDVTRHGGVLEVALAVPKRRNALSRAVITQMGEALSDLPPEVTGVVLTGRGQAFSAGADFADLTGTAADAAYDKDLASLTHTITELPLVVVAAIEGACVGAAVDLVLACDARVAGQGSYLHVPAVRLGLLYNPDSVARMHATHPHALRRLLLLAEPIPAEEAITLGLVSHLVPRGDAAKQAHALLADTVPEHLPAVAATKTLLNDLAAGRHDLGGWADRRLELLDSPARKAAIDQAHRRHAPTPKAGDDD